MPDARIVTGLGAVSAFGDGIAALTEGIFAGRDGLTPMERFDVSPLHPIRLAGWARHRLASDDEASAERWAIEAAREAWRDAGAPVVGPARVAVVLGSTEGDRACLAELSRSVRRALGAAGPSFTISTACSSSADALGAAMELLDEGEADVVIAGGAETLVPEMFAGFAALGVLSGEKCAPFGEIAGTTLGEGAGVMIVERAGLRDGQRAHAFLLGHGLSSDAYHETSPDPRGEGIARAMSACLLDAGLAAADVHYVNAHATGTEANDLAEWRGVQRALGASASTIAISGSKGHLGHAQGAAGVLEAISTIVCMERGAVPPSLRVGGGRRGGPPDPVDAPVPRETQVDVALATSAAFGGANAVIAIGARPRTLSSRATRDVFIAGSARIGHERGAPRDDTTWRADCAELDLRASDPSCRMVAAACARSLRDADLKIRGALRDRAGIVGGIVRPSPSSIAELEASLLRGMDKASAPAFARIVAHAPFATASRLLSLRGPLSALVTDDGAGLLAFVRAARLVRDGRADVMLAAAVDERSPASDEQEGASSLVLSSAPSAVRVAGTAIASPGHVEDAVSHALRAAGRALGSESTLVRVTSPPGCEPSLDALAGAVALVRDGERAVLVSLDGRDVSLAVVLVAHP